MKKLLSGIFGDILFLYKNFLHFSVSKIIILLTIISYIIILLVPILVIFLVIFYFLGMFDGSFNPYLFIGNPYYMGFGILFIILSFFAYIIGFSYSQILLTNLNLGYIKREKLAFFKNYYFNRKIFFTYLKLTGTLIGILLLPILVWFLGFIVLVIIYGGINESLGVINSGATNGLSLWLLLLTMISSIVFLYLSYKTMFSYIILVSDYDKKAKLKKVSYYIKKSFKFTKGIKKFFKIIFLLLILLIVTYPIYYFEDYFEVKAKDIKKYITYSSIISAGGDLKEKTLEYEALKLDFGDKKILDLSFKMKKYSNFSILFYILEFLLVWGLYNMALVSFYNRKK